MDFPQLLDEYNVPWISEGHEHAREGYIQLDCPNCEQEGHWRLGYNLSTGFVNCWSCGRMSLTWVISKILNIPMMESKSIIRELGVTASARDRNPKNNPQKSPQAQEKGVLSIPKGLGPLRKHHRDYLIGRGLSPKHLTKVWGARGITIHHRLSHRIWIPIRDHKGEIVSWSTRRLDDEVPRFLNARKSEESKSCKEVLFGEDLMPNKNAVAVCEGLFSTIALGAGVGVGTLGTAYTQKQLLRIAKYKNVFVVFDNEEVDGKIAEGQKAAKKLCQELSAFECKVTNIVLEGGSDPAKKEALEEVLQIRKMIRRLQK